MSNTIGRAKILTAPCIFFKKRYAAPVREDFGEDFGEDFRGREAGKKAGAGGTGQDEPQARTERDKADESGRDRAAAGPTEAGRAWKRVRKRGGKRTKKTGETRKNGKTGKNWKMLEKTGKSDRGLPGRRSGGTGRERHSAVKPRRYRSLKPSSSTSTGQYSRSSSRRKRTV